MSERSEWTATTHDWAHDVDAEHLAQVRRDVSAYGAGGLRHMILEVLAYANDEAEATGNVGLAVVTTNDDGTVTVTDDGRGTDTRLDRAGQPIRKSVMATKDIRFFDAMNGPRLPDGLPRYGMSVVAALSSSLVHENHRQDGAWSQTYRHGIPHAELRPISSARTTGTSVTFRPDAQVRGPGWLTDSDRGAFPRLRIQVHDPE